MTIELHGIVLHGFHGVLEHERRDGQRFLVDVELDLEHEQASRTDEIDDAVDYRQVVARVQAQLAGLEVMAERVDSVELRVLQA